MIRIKDLLKAVVDSPDFRDGLLSRGAAPETEEERKEQEELGALFKFIGFYIVTFQQVEAELDQIILLILGQERWHVGQGVAALLSNSQKIDLVQTMVLSSALSNGTEFQQKWTKDFNSLLSEVRQEGTRRNTIVHSLYLFDFMKAGMPILQSKRRRKKGEVDFDQQFVDVKYIETAAASVSALSVDLGFARRQLIAWLDEVQRTRPRSHE